MLTIENAHSPKFTNSEKSQIDLMVKFFEFHDELPFTASKNSNDSYSLELFNNAVNGSYGEIANFIPSIIYEIPKSDQPITEGLEEV